MEMKSVKEYPLSIDHLIGDGVECYVTKGFHPLHLFAARLSQRRRDDKLSPDLDYSIWSKPAYEWWRAVPVRGERGCLYHPAKPYSRGAFPVTVVQSDG